MSKNLSFSEFNFVHIIANETSSNNVVQIETLKKHNSPVLSNNFAIFSIGRVKIPTD